MSKEELSKYHAGFNACWQYYKKYATASNFNSDEFWQEVVTEADQIAKRYDSAFINKIIFAVIDELERMARKARYEGI